MTETVDAGELNRCPADPSNGPGICSECCIRFAQERPMVPKVYCWRNGVAAFPDGLGGCSLQPLGAEALLQLREKGLV
jgi:hypothetical protein